MGALVGNTSLLWVLEETGISRGLTRLSAHKHSHVLGSVSYAKVCQRSRKKNTPSPTGAEYYP